ncbi:asparagine synthase-related protein [Deltaproteobacteria bacterium TL4]
MSQLMTHYPFYVQDPLFHDTQIAATRVHTDTIQLEPQPYEAEGLAVWLDGEFYNQTELQRTYQVSGNRDPVLLAQLIRRDPSLEFLKQINGIFAAVIYDSRRKQVFLLTDRYGLRHLHWTVHQRHLIWTSEIKALLEFPGYTPQISRGALVEFFDTGYLLGNRTWFEHVTLLPSGSVLKWDLETQTQAIHVYWNWDMLPQKGAHLNEDEIIEELGRLFVQSVKIMEQGPTGIALSGGLDSRALLAALSPRATAIPAFTFGKVGCEDIEIAKQVASLGNTEHHVLELDQFSWIQRWQTGVWLTEGHKNIIHMHILSLVPLMRTHCRILLDGFLGDAILGGSYLNDPRWSMTEKITHRGRRFVTYGVRLCQSRVHSRLPFFENELFEFILSIPPRLRQNSYIYHQMLLRRFPDYFQSIPWQHTGLPVSAYRPQQQITLFVRKVRGKLLRDLPFLGNHFQDDSEYAAYARWMRQEPIGSFFQQVLKNPKALYGEFLSKQAVLTLWQKHLQGHNYAEALGRYVAFELWLQQIFEKKYRSMDDE